MSRPVPGRRWLDVLYYGVVGLHGHGVVESVVLAVLDRLNAGSPVAAVTLLNFINRALWNFDVTSLHHRGEVPVSRIVDTFDVYLHALSAFLTSYLVLALSVGHRARSKLFDVLFAQDIEVYGTQD